MNKKYKKLLIVSGSLVLISSIFLLKISFLGNKNKATAQTIICEETVMVGEGEDEEEQNALEIPIGKAVDQAEYLADQIASHAREIINIVPSQIQAVNDLSALAQKCGAMDDNGVQLYCVPDCRQVKVCGECHGRGCDTETENECSIGLCASEIVVNKVCCCAKGTSDPLGLASGCNDDESNNPSVCSGADKTDCEGKSHCCCTTSMDCEPFPCQNAPGLDRACPLGLLNQAAIVSGFTGSIVAHQEAIPPLIEGFGSSNDTDRDLVLPKLEESRRKLFDCVVTPGEAAAVLRGDTSGKWLVSCDALLSYFIPVHSYLPFRDGNGDIITPEELEQDCYGQTYCDALNQQDETPPYDYPCANDYYCCFMSP